MNPNPKSTIALNVISSISFLVFQGLTKDTILLIVHLFLEVLYLCWQKICHPLIKISLIFGVVIPSPVIPQPLF